MIRKPAVAGRFYPDDPVRLTEQLDSLLRAEAGADKVHALACLVPHAGYRYSGGVAAAVFGRVEIPPRVILIGPRHFPRGAPLAITSGGYWRTPLGPAAVDDALAAKLLKRFPVMQEDALAHRDEHSLEVQLPFLQHLARDGGPFTFVPVLIGPLRFTELDALGRALAQLIRDESGPILLIASSDMNHYEPDNITRAKDRAAIDCMLALEPQALFDTARNQGISMCGLGAAVVILTAARELGATRGELLRYATSSDVSGDLEEAVGYAGMVFS